MSDNTPAEATAVPETSEGAEAAPEPTPTPVAQLAEEYVDEHNDTYDDAYDDEEDESAESPAPAPPPNFLALPDRLQLQLFNERALRIEAQIALLEMRVTMLRTEQTKNQDDARLFQNTVSAQYQLKGRDVVDISTGAITRR